MHLWRPPLALFVMWELFVWRGHCLLGVGIVCGVGEKGGVGEIGSVGEFGENFSVRAEPISEKKS